MWKSGLGEKFFMSQESEDVDDYHYKIGVIVMYGDIIVSKIIV